jgi:hypothetical protein
MKQMRKLAMVLLTAALSGCGWMGGGAQSPFADTEVQPSQGPYETGRSYFEQEQFGLALAAFRESLRQHPDAPRELNAVAACYDQMLRFDLADRYYDLALNIDPNSVQTLNNLGYSHYRRSQEGYGSEYLMSARAYLARASALAGGNPVVAKNLDLIETSMAQLGTAEPLAASLPGIRIAEQDPYTSWIERMSPTSVLVVTRPDPETATLARSLGVLPRIAAVSVAAHAVVPPKLEVSRAEPTEGGATSAGCDGPMCVLSRPPFGFLGGAGPIPEEHPDPARDGRIEIAALQGGWSGLPVLCCRMMSAGSGQQGMGW